MTERTALFVPVYNEAETLSAVLSRLPADFHGVPIDIIVADDCSTDESVSIARQFTPFVVSAKKNAGVGAVTKLGLCFIAERGGYGKVIKFDGDGQHDVNLLPKVERCLDKNRVVVCSRFHPESDQTYTPIDRILLNSIFAEILRKITGWNITDARSGFMGFHFEDMAMIAPHLIVERYGIPMELLLRVWNRDTMAPFCEIPHPALYGGDISKKMQVKYSTEQLNQKSDRLRMAYEALLAVVNDLKISKEAILRI